MIVKQYIKDFEKLGLGMFVHFGLYSIIGMGEWVKFTHDIPIDEYKKNMSKFKVSKDWAHELVRTAKEAGCKYITLTTRHHDGFSLYDTCGLNTYDAVHSAAGRDLVREFVDECNKQGIIPFFYHTLIDWSVQYDESTFSKYLEYLRASVEIICKNYGKIGGLWFDGMWDHRDWNWEEDALYGMIRKYQPEAMIINNTGMDRLGMQGHIELDSVTYERGQPVTIDLNDRPKYLASEMCQIFGNYWGYSPEDIDYKPVKEILGNLIDNAIEASMKENEPYIDITIKQEKSFFIIKIINKYSEKLPPNLATSKKDSKFHGIGLNSVRHTVHKYTGSFDIVKRDNTVVATAMMLTGYDKDVLTSDSEYY